MSIHPPNTPPFHGVTNVPIRDLPTSDEWLDKVAETINRIGVRQVDLAEWIGAPQSGISQMLTRRQPRTKWVERVSAALGIALPRPARVALLAQELEESGDTDALDAAILTMEARIDAATKRQK